MSEGERPRVEPGDGPVFVSAVEGFAVARYGTGTTTRANQLIGCERRSDDSSQITWHTDRVIAIPRAEYLAHKREYDREIAAGALTLRTVRDYDAHQRDRERLIEKAHLEAEAAKAEQPKAKE